MSSSRNQEKLQTAAEILRLTSQELEHVLDLEFQSLKLVPLGSSFPTEFPSFKNKLIGEILLKGNDENWVTMTRKLLHRNTERRFYFSDEEMTAVTRILATIDEQADMLDLSDLKLQAIPPLVKAVSVQALDISKNNLRDLRPISNLQSLERLYAHNNGIDDLEVISRMPNLELLSLSNNQVSNCRLLSSLKGLKHLDLRNNRIGDPREIVFLLNHLSPDVLLLSGNYLNIPVNILDNVQKLRRYNELGLWDSSGGAGKAPAKNISKTPRKNSGKVPKNTSKTPEEDKAPESTAADHVPPGTSFRSFATGQVWLTGAPEENLLDVKDISKILYESIANTEDRVEQFFGLFGRWGRGKTHLWNYLKKEFIEARKDTSEERYIPVEFHAWKYQDTPGLWAYLYCELNKSYFDKAPNKLRRFQRLVWLNYVRGKILRPALLWLGGLCFIAIAYLFLKSRVDFFKETNVQIFAAAGVVSVSLYSLGKYLEDRYRSTIRRLFTQMTSNVNLTSHLGLQHEIQEELKSLLKAWLPQRKKDEGKPHKRIFLFIDDIDRCSEDKIIQIVDYIRVLLHDTAVQSRITVLAAIDERILIHAIQNKYLRFIENKDNNASYQELCREYMDKLFLASLKLGRLTNFEKEEVVNGFTRKYLKRPVLLEPTIALEETQSEPIGELHTGLESPTPKSLRTPEEKLSQAKLPDPQEKEQDYSLEPWEQNFLRKMVANADLTPRGIRVYTHRYLLGKKLVEKALTNSRKPSWGHWYHSAEAKECFALKLLHYSFRAGVPELYQDYNNYIKNYDENNTVTETVYHLKVSLNQELGSIMYQVLTMIVAY